jgi:hypothetical protein
MKHKGIVGLAVASALVMSATAALGASDYLLEIEGVTGEAGASDASTKIEISSFSWGTSNPTSVGSSGMSAGKVSMQDMSVSAAAAPSATAQAVRESPTKQSTGKTVAPAAAAGAPAGASPPKVGDMATVTVMLRESPTKASTGKTSRSCMQGEHISQVVLVAQGKRYEMHDVVVTACGPSADGMRQKELTGHVTLIK